MPHMYHPDLGREIDVPDASAEVLAESGWKLAPEPEVVPGIVPEPTVYAPVTDPAPKADAKKRGAKTEPDKGEDTSK